MEKFPSGSGDPGKLLASSIPLNKVADFSLVKEIRSK